MKVMVIGGGGREHALAWKLAQSSSIERVLVAPGNAGTAGEPKCENLAIRDNDVAALVAAATQHQVGLVVIGPESALVAGVADAMREQGIPTVGPGAAGAMLEASKAFSKQLMVDAGVPTAAFAQVATEEEALRFIAGRSAGGLVVKADGLAAGKGVVVCDTLDEARTDALAMLRDRPFGDACSTLVLEERLTGPELSYIVLTDGTHFLPMPTAQDHKRLLDGDLGPNTGGMGAYSPVPFVTPELAATIHASVIEPTLAALRTRGIPFRGFLYAGLMLTPDGPRVLEFNTRLGDPEAQAILLAFRGDILPMLLACAAGDLSATTSPLSTPAAVIVLAAEGYPLDPVKDTLIVGVEEAEVVSTAKVFHAGTRLDRGLRVNGGRVLGVAAHGNTPDEAVSSAYLAAACIRWSGMQYRTDIGKALNEP